MPIRPTVIQRAVELAETGLYKDMQAIERQLTKEQYEDPHFYITGALRRKLAAVVRERFQDRQADKDLKAAASH